MMIGGVDWKRIANGFFKLLFLALFFVSGCAPAYSTGPTVTQSDREGSNSVRTEVNRPFFQDSAQNRQIIKIAGSTAATPVLQDLVAEFLRSEPDVVFKIQGGGSQLGEMQVATSDAYFAFSTLFDSPTINAASTITTTQIISAANSSAANSSATEDISPESLKTARENLIRTPIALSGLALIVHIDNPVGSLSLEEMKQIYNGRTTEWSEVADGQSAGEVLLISREVMSGARTLFDERILAGDRLSLTALIAPTNAAVIETVGANVAAIGYVDRSYVAHLLPNASPELPQRTASGEATVRIVAIDGLQPESSVISSQQYPLVYPIYIVQRAAHSSLGGNLRNADADKFINWISRERGQQIVGRFHVLLR